MKFPFVGDDTDEPIIAFLQPELIHAGGKFNLLPMLGFQLQ
jgi:hypothetical protein